MNREIKFRGKSINTGNWIVGMTISKGNIKRKANNYYFEINVGQWEGVLPETVGQYTGLKDKNGVEIYEGDICIYLGTNMSDMEIKFENGCFIGEGLFTSPTLKDLMSATDFESIEVISNIYENK